MTGAAPPPGDAAVRITLPEFEGPLDLLLHLCKTHELDIVNIPIAFVTEKYLAYLDLMHSMSLDVAADYLVMAATLAYLKSRELVPQPEPLEGEGEDAEEAIDPREALIRQLLEYSKYKDAAEKLGGRPIEGRTVFGRGAALDGGDPGLADHSVWKLIEALGRVLEKAGPEATHDVLVDRVSISERINQLLDRIEQGGGSFRFDTCFDLGLGERDLRNQVVVTLLAVLELARLKVIRLVQTVPGDPATLFITQVDGASLEAARKVEVTAGKDAAGAGSGGDGEGAGGEKLDGAGTAGDDSREEPNPDGND